MRTSAVTDISGRPAVQLRRCLILAGLATLTGCSGAPVINVVGSYFPAWLLSGLIGISVAILVRQLLILARLEDSLVVPLLTHTAVGLAATLMVWLVWFGH